MSYYDIDGIGYIAFRETFLSRIHVIGKPVAEAYHYETHGNAVSNRYRNITRHKREQNNWLYSISAETKKNTPNGLLDFINIEKIQRLKKSGIKILTLGWTPLAGLSPQHDKGESAYTHQILRFSHKHLNIVYAYKDLAFHKERYRANTTLLFFAFDTRLPLKNLTELLWISRIYSPANTYHNKIRFTCNAKRTLSNKIQKKQSRQFASS